MLDVRKLALLREVAVHGGITGAARALHMSASNVSQQLGRLESEHGVALLEPSGRGVRLTAAAERLVDQTESVLAILEEAESDLADSRDGGTSVIRLAAFHTFAAGLLGAAVRHLSDIAPTLELDFVQLDPEAALDEILSRRADIAVADEYPGLPLLPMKGLVRIPIGDEPIGVYLPEGATDPSRVAWAMEPRHSDSYRWARSVCRAAGFEPRVRFESPDPYVHRRLTEQGLAASFLPATVVRGAKLSDGAAAHDLLRDGIGMYRTHVFVVRRGAERSPAVVACRRAIETAFRDASTLRGTPPLASRPARAHGRAP